MKKPEVVNPKLKQLVDKLWTNDPNPIGDGSVADAIRHEIETGDPVKVTGTAKRVRLISRLLKNGLGAKPIRSRKVIRIQQEQSSRT